VKRVSFIDTSILCEFLDLPGRNTRHASVRAEFNHRYANGEQFVIPVTAVIETGNYIEQCSGDRRAAAKRFCDLLDAIIDERAPLLLHEMEWGSSMLRSFIDGDSTGSSFVDLAGAGRLGGGDVAILVERDHFRSRNPVGAVVIWTFDAELEALAKAS
jgi:predicted nucleic acid-binding protein